MHNCSMLQNLAKALDMKQKTNLVTHRECAGAQAS
jgi:hypothetical protein